MSTFSSFLPAKLLNINNRDRSSDPLSRLRFALETMPGSRKYEFTPLTRTEIITELYDAFWGSHANHFVSNPSANLPLHTSLHELQHRLGFGGAGRRENQPRVGRVATSLEKVNAVFGVGE
jgi:E3 ubiquitin-protein ligase UBR1